MAAPSPSAISRSSWMKAVAGHGCRGMQVRDHALPGSGWQVRTSRSDRPSSPSLPSLLLTVVSSQTVRGALLGVGLECTGHAGESADIYITADEVVGGARGAHVAGRLFGGVCVGACIAAPRPEAESEQGQRVLTAVACRAAPSREACTPGALVPLPLTTARIAYCCRRRRFPCCNVRPCRSWPPRWQHRSSRRPTCRL